LILEETFEVKRGEQVHLNGINGQTKGQMKQLRVSCSFEKSKNVIKFAENMYVLKSCDDWIKNRPRPSIFCQQLETMQDQRKRRINTHDY
jgi:hypothetical protein